MWLSAAAPLLLVAAACGGRAQPSGGAAPRGTYTTQVRGYLVRLATNARNLGFTRNAGGPVYGNLRDDATGSHQMTVTGGNEYILFGACDNDCTDVDLRIFDASGNLVMQDLAVNDTPTLQFRANGSGKYRVQVVMATCTRNPCYYGIQLMAR